MVSRKDRIYEAVEKYTREMIDSGSLDRNGIDALEISLSLKLDRANVSRELNALWKEGRIIKLQGRPTLYVDYRAIKTEYPNRYIPLVISRESSLTEFIQKTQKESHKELPFHQTPLDNIIGVNGSLKEETEKFIAAISYPPCGLPVLLMGNAGVGKRKFAESIYYYALEKHILQENAQFIIINCQDYAHSDDRLMAGLLGLRRSRTPGVKPAKGLIEAAGHGIVYFDGLHKLPSKSIDLIIDILKNGSYTRIGDNHPRPLEAMFIASVRSSLEPELLDNIKDAFPVMISLPDFDKRNSLEKIQTILYLFTREAFSIQKNIRLDKSIITAFAMSSYRKNESQLRGEIQSACSKALLDQHNGDSHFITIGFEHLSSFLLSATQSSQDTANYLIRSLAMYKKEIIVCESDGHCDALEYFKQLPFRQEKSADLVSLFDIDINEVNQYSSLIYKITDHLKDSSYEQASELKRRVNPDVESILYKCLSGDSSFQSLLENSRLLAGLAAGITSLVKKGMDAHTSYTGDIASRHPREYSLAQTICAELAGRLHQNIHENTAVFIACYLVIGSRIMKKARLAVLVVCHGRYTASEMKRYTDNMAKEANIRTAAVNYTENLPLDELLTQMCSAVKRLNHGAGVLILADMEPITGMEAAVQRATRIPCRILPSVTLPGLMDAIMKCGGGASLDQFTSCTPSAAPSYKELSQEEFINHLVNDILSRTLLYVNPRKATDTLLYSLNTILDELKLSYTQEIAVKYLSHGVHMIERIIRGLPLPYYQLRQFTDAHHQLMDIIAESLSIVSDTFAISIPSSEIAYLAEIFLAVL